MGQTIYATSPLAIGQIIYVTVPSKPCGAPSRRRAPPGAGSATDASTHATSPPETCGLHPAGHDLLQGAGTTRRGERDRCRDVLAERGARVDLVDVRVTPAATLHDDLLAGGRAKLVTQIRGAAPAAGAAAEERGVEAKRRRGVDDHPVDDVSVHRGDAVGPDEEGRGRAVRLGHEGGALLPQA